MDGELLADDADDVDLPGPEVIPDLVVRELSAEELHPVHLRDP